MLPRVAPPSDSSVTALSILYAHSCLSSSSPKNTPQPAIASGRPLFSHVPSVPTVHTLHISSVFVSSAPHILCRILSMRLSHSPGSRTLEPVTIVYLPFPSRSFFSRLGVPSGDAFLRHPKLSCHPLHTDLCNKQSHHRDVCFLKFTIDRHPPFFTRGSLYRHSPKKVDTLSCLHSFIYRFVVGYYIQKLQCT